MWLYVAFIGYACLAVVAILDKYILSSEKVKPLIFVFYSTVFLAPFTFAFPFLSQTPSLFEWLIIFLSAAAFVLSLGTMYLSFERTEVSRSGPFIGALVPLFILILSQTFLSEVISQNQIFGIVLLSLGSFIISFEKKMSLRLQTGLGWAVVSAFIFASFHVSAKYIYSAIGFFSGFVYILGVVGFIGCCLIFTKTVKERLFNHANIFQRLYNRIFQKEKTTRQAVAIVSDKVLGALGMLLIQYAVSIGSVSKVNALNGLQYGLLIIIVAFLSTFFPAIFKERYSAGKLKYEVAAVCVIAVGLAFLVM